MKLIDLHYSFRRQMIDQELNSIIPLLHGVVLDVGGKKVKKRGTFKPPISETVDWFYLNRDKNETPDLVADGEFLPFKKNLFDWIVCTEVLEFIKHPDNLVLEITRTLKAGGKLFLTAPFLYRIHGRPHDLQRFTEEKLRTLFSGHSLNILMLQPQGYFFTVLADFIKSAIAQIKFTPVRYLSACFLLPIVCLLRWIEQGDWVKKSAFLSSFTSGYVLIAQKI